MPDAKFAVALVTIVGALVITNADGAILIVMSCCRAEITGSMFFITLAHAVIITQAGFLSPTVETANGTVVSKLKLQNFPSVYQPNSRFAQPESS